MTKKRFWQIALKFAALIVILALTFTGLSFLFVPRNNNVAFGVDSLTANGILGEPKNTIDLLVLGDSEAYASFSPMEIWKTYGVTSYVCATANQLLVDSRHFLEQAFENQTPKIVLLEVNACFRQIKLSDIVEARIETVFPLFYYHDRWKTLKLSDFKKGAEYSWKDDYKGFRFNKSIDPIMNEEYMIKTDEVEELSAMNEESLEKIIEFCNNHGAKLILYSAPSIKNWSYEKHNGIQLFTNRHNLDYVDTNIVPEVKIDWLSETRDRGDHVNYFGAVKVTDYVGKFIMSKYKLPDHRNDPQYDVWNNSQIVYDNSAR